MRKLLLLSLLVPQLGQAITCPGAGTLQNQYYEQSSWNEIEVNGGSQTIPVVGGQDTQGGFHIYELDGRFDLPAQLDMVETNLPTGGFAALCRDYDGEATILSHFRTGERGNQYTLNLNYLPSLDSFTNDPLEGIQTDSFEVYLDVTANSLLARARDARTARGQILAQLTEQVNNQAVGGYALNLNNMDDLVCDLLHGQASIRIHRRMSSSQLFVIREETMSQVAYQTLLSGLAPQTQEAALPTVQIFKAGMRVQEKLARGELPQIPEAQLNLVVSEVFANPAVSLLSWNDNQKQCLYDRLQNYSEERKRHVLNIGLTVPDFTVLFPESQP